MAKVSPEIEAFARIKVIGVGGSGTNAVNHMVRSKIKGVEFIAVNTDAQDLHHSMAPKKIHIGKNLTRGLGTGMNPELGRKAAEETLEDVQGVIRGADMVFIACGMGGGTGTGASPVVARSARDQGILTIGVVTKPFVFEGVQRSRMAEQGIEELSKEVDALIAIPNDRLLQIIGKNTSVSQAFAMCDEILLQAVEGISELITTPGIINVDFADIRTVLEDAGSALMGVGVASGENRATEAAKAAINSPLLDVSIEGARGVLFAISGGDDMSMMEIQEAAQVITDSIDPEAKVIFGTIHDTRLKKGQVKITVIASGFGGAQATPKRKGLFNTGVAEAGRPENKQETRAVNQAPNLQSPASSFQPPVSSSDMGVIMQKREAVKKDEPEEDDSWAMPAFLRRKK